MNYLKHDSAPECRTYTQDDVYNYNYHVWTVAYFVGLQFTHMDQGIFTNFTLDWNIMKTWPWYMWVLFLGLILLLGSIFAYIFFLYHTVGFLHFYVVALLVFAAFMYIHTKRMAAKGYHLHIHHYFLGMIVMAFTCYQSTFLTIV
jgi:hypothetical protein